MVPGSKGISYGLGTPTVLIDRPYYIGRNLRRTYDISPDGQRFLMIRQGDLSGATPGSHLIVIENWVEELKRLVPTN